MASKSFVKLVHRAYKSGYRVDLIYVALPSVALAKPRVRKRVASGSHDIPAAVIERRFYRSLVNLVGLYSIVVDHWRVYDNSLLAILELILSGEGRELKFIRRKNGKDYYNSSKSRANKLDA